MIFFFVSFTGSEIDNSQFLFILTCEVLLGPRNCSKIKPREAGSANHKIPHE
jgi:hypothetical protein